MFQKSRNILKQKTMSDKIISPEDLSKIEDLLYRQQVGKTILAGQNYLANLEVLKRTPLWKGKIKATGNQLINLLIAEERTNFAAMERAEKTIEGMQGKQLIDHTFKVTEEVVVLATKLALINLDVVKNVMVALGLNPSAVSNLADNIIDNHEKEFKTHIIAGKEACQAIFNNEIEDFFSQDIPEPFSLIVFNLGDPVKDLLPELIGYEDFTTISKGTYDKINELLNTKLDGTTSD